ncbi:Tim10/DDP family zinc finger-domain-containing protein [Lactarius hengduanensis]|uniref:Mitochondrial import inner membrane translocase subunit n=1 Tax=Lactarius akahatsu TaxID=416441 RepID=A0AAD4LHW1_9AGAM|nr:Tim10/DDP family zinc finger-domain-containing protein [Lactarius akahatsu]KAH9043745.1 Tim10/DDP family zinc finger-domain-containing protein [Lactarius pseudohatsudake]KAH9049448.1 Tim10/DDP family zinc finger-domain-containing protein [Lactarius hengduanensis]KAH9060865.1 Tim10/DDP family zinc finger-domain-containing protein [Lactarius vividus]KAH9176957.1 Tim10/DDP family zinc finger-domain-containing protein [Lactarius sanguifluus]KAI9445450.1 Tim10/DDP family zinc finger-domain-conta
MSMFGRSPNAPTGSVNPERVEMAIQELDMVTDIFNRLVSTCHAKCISTRYAEGDLNKGESVCIDRCVAKFFEANKKVGERLQNVGANASGATGAFGL